MRTLAALIISFFATSTAVAGPGYGLHDRRPSVVVHVDAFSPGYIAPYRHGFSWIDGHYDTFGGWVPGFYQPLRLRAGHSWVPGHWNHRRYMAGFWRPQHRPGHAWTPGHYNGRNFVSGRWAVGRPVVHHAPSVRYGRTLDHRPNPRARTVVTPRSRNTRPVHHNTRPAARGTTRPTSSMRPRSSRVSAKGHGSSRVRNGVR